MSVTIETLKSVSNYSRGVAKLYDACDTFLNLAKDYMDKVVGEQIWTGFEGYDMDLDAMLDEWELGLAGEDAREMSSFLMGPGGETAWNFTSR